MTTGTMTVKGTLGEIQTAISQLSPADYAALKEWLAEREADQWDKQIEADVKAGKLDALAGKTSQL